ncbi:MAG: bifunctional UDP-N-acetylmuramoyl-tripeptide:D-alanyl-D-alanine ligase/alanine racemase [Bacteroidales bacterium]|nr:bifunctional UDP-N-acetylmuramoyl-tripeptide:D-alanyl-D-alanine ligase/alanine racemase [Bacteroidales bacterium]
MQELLYYVNGIRGGKLKTDVRTIAEITGSSFTGDPGLEVIDLLTDSRKVSALSEGTMFIALRGEKNDGHTFIAAMYRAGVRIFLVSGKYYEAKEDYPGSAFIIAEDSLSALQYIAAWKRRNYRGLLISITGSNGKTIIKEWLSDILAKHRDVIRSPRSYNSQLGVPLSLWYLSNDYDTAVIEAGMSQPGEIERLEKMIRPQIGVFTHIGEAHQENFTSLEDKIHEKLGLFVNSEVIIYPADKKQIHEAIINDNRLRGKRLFSWTAEENKADIIISPGLKAVDGPELRVKSPEEDFICRIPFSDKASVDNISTLIAILLYLGLDGRMISEGVRGLSPLAMRMEQKEGINNCLLLEDFYNSDPGSLRIALEALKGISDKDMTLVLSDFVQGRRNRDQLYRGVAENIKKSGVSKLMAIGDDLQKYSGYFDVDNASFFKDTDEFIRSFLPGTFKNEAILLKGARKYEFERIGRLLELKTHQTRLEINLNAVLSNLNTFRSYLKKGTRIMAMVKAFAYGTGPREISEWLSYNGIDYLAVAYPDEGISLRKEGITSRIMVMNPDPFSLRSLLEYDLEPEIYSHDILSSFINETKRYGTRDYPVHIKLDTGMHRLGFTEEDIEEMADKLVRCRSVKIASVFSHLAAAYNKDMDKYSHDQAVKFVEMSKLIREMTGSDFIRHLLNSAGIARFPLYQFDMVRLGIGMYGISEVEMNGLKPAAAFYTRISQVKIINAGEGLGYGLKDAGPESRRIAILPLGYADGLRRMMGRGRGYVYAGGRHLPIRGNVCMDMCMVDISGTDLKAGDEVEVFGENISINEVAGICETIPYEILTGIPVRVKRIFLYE